MKLRRIAAAVVVAVLATTFQRISPAEAGPGTRILDYPEGSQDAARQWAAANGAPQFYIDLVPRYWAIATARGVRPDVAYAQSAKETNFGKFGGVVDPSFQNPCGMKTTAGGANGDPNAHQRFPDWDTGITACVDHLALYAGAPGYPRAGSPDPRHFAFIFGTATIVEGLGGRWAPSLDYGHSIVNGYLAPMVSTGRCGGLSDIPNWARDQICWLVLSGHATGYPDRTFRPNWSITRAQVANMLWGIAARPDPGAGCAGLLDVPPWAQSGICSLVNQGHATGYPNSTFQPDWSITRAQFASMVWGIAGSPPSGAGCGGLTDVPLWAQQAICWMVEQGHATGYPDRTFRPDSSITRAQVANMLHGIHA
jgi:hypothetical protein